MDIFIEFTNEEMIRERVKIGAIQLDRIAVKASLRRSSIVR
jgi:hypothetical protein